MSCPECKHPYTHERKPKYFPCTHGLCEECLELFRVGDFSFTCRKCHRRFPDISVAVVVPELIGPQSLDDKIKEIKEQKSCLNETKIFIKSHIRTLKAALPNLEIELDSNFKKIQEELIQQHNKYKEKYLKLKVKEITDIKSSYHRLIAAIKKRDDILGEVHKRIGADIPDPLKKEISSLSYPESIKFAKFGINFQEDNEQIPDKIMGLFWTINQTFINDSDLEHLASEPYKKFKPNDYSTTYQTGTIVWDKFKLSKPIE